MYKRKFQVPGLDEVILHFNQSICVGEGCRHLHKKSSSQVMPFVGTRNGPCQGSQKNRQFESETADM